ncbi:cytochrome C peroxidase [Persicirhabdus sediminis]|uniref:Cytochrome C peroxidase n=1 Tax=Persicirhabdus sediminis TaxID=454144 RepID=A0A8J7ME66_9BACT|nr:cytochrome C peroxidase [Persicirhabdus sediminis]
MYRSVISLIFCFAANLPAEVDLRLNFSHQLKGKALIADSLRYKNASSEVYSSTRLSYLVSGIALHAENGQIYNVSELVGYIDDSSSRHSIQLADVPAGKYSALSFYIGLDQQQNHSNPALYPANHPLNPNLNNMHWDWQGGYIFMALEGHCRQPGEKMPTGYAYHFANDANRTRVMLEAEIDLQTDSAALISFDIAKLLSQISFADDGATTHSQAGDPVAEKIRAAIPSAFQLQAVAPVRAMPSQPVVEAIDLPASITPHPITLPKYIPIPKLPLDNPLLTERVELGEMLFHETKLSRTNELSCASCHQGETLSDPRQFSPGVDGKHNQRHSMPLVNLAWKKSFFWDGRASSLRLQALMPIEDHLEMDESLDKVVAKLENDPVYQNLFAAAFGSAAISAENIGLAMENFLLTQMSFDSKFDRASKGLDKLTKEEQRGFELFFTEFEPRLGKFGADCFHCHGGALFTDHSFHNNGLTTNDDIGLAATTGKASDRYKFSTPSLRNISLTAPYMHDGRFSSLEQVIDHYNSPIEASATLDPNLAKHPQGLGLSAEDKNALIAFLKTL